MRASPAPGGPLAALAHLPDASEDLARTADLTVGLAGVQLKLHSAVLSAGSRVWRTALCACGAGGGGGGGGAAAIARSLEGHELPDVRTFLRLLYDPTVVERMNDVELASWQGVLELASKLDAPTVLWVSSRDGRCKRVAKALCLHRQRGQRVPCRRAGLLRHFCC